MSGELRSFNFEGRAPVRTAIGEEGEPRWVAKDVADALGYAEGSNPARLFAAVPTEWKGVNRIHTPGGAQDMLCITEQGLYFFLGRSDKPKALPFQKWLAGEVLPAIRKTGAYAAPTQPGDETFTWIPMTEAANRAGVGRTALQYRCAQFGIPTRKAGPFCLVPWEQVERHFAEHPIRADRGRHAEVTEVSDLGTVVDLLNSVLEIYGSNQAKIVLHGIDPGRFPHPAPQGGAR